MDLLKSTDDGLKMCPVSESVGGLAAMSLGEAARKRLNCDQVSAKNQ